MVPGVTMRTTSRRTTTTDFALPSSPRRDPRSARRPQPGRARSGAAGSHRRARSARRIGMSSPWCLPRFVSTIPSARLAISASSKQLVEIPCGGWQRTRIRRLDLQILRHHGGDAGRILGRFRRSAYGGRRVLGRRLGQSDRSGGVHVHRCDPSKRAPPCTPLAVGLRRDSVERGEAAAAFPLARLREAPERSPD